MCAPSQEDRHLAKRFEPEKDKRGEGVKRVYINHRHGTLLLSQIAPKNVGFGSDELP